MEINDLYDFLTSSDFKNPDTGNLFFPAYIMTYPPEDEYLVRQKISEFKDRMKRPNNFLDTLVINIYDEFIDYLKNTKILGDSLLNLIFDKETDDGIDETVEYLKSRINTDEFYERMAITVNNHFKNEDNLKKVFLVVHGFGSVFPFLRASVFINNFHKYIKNYKLIIFYPGEYKNGSYYLFNDLNDKHLYRATLLNKLK